MKTYTVFGIPLIHYVCDSCRGTGMHSVPSHIDDDGTIHITSQWMFVTCDTCNGTGKKSV